MEANEIYQYSLLNALMDGVCEHGIPASKLASKGNQGLGTFVKMDGELIMLDGKVYQMRPGGNITEVEPTAQIPFGCSTNFAAQQTKKVELKDKYALDRILDDSLGKAQNNFMTYRINGHFKYLKCRTVRGQEYPGQKLAELGKKQSVEEYHDVDGTVVGFRTPEIFQGLNVAGQHLHFITDDRKKGGHVLEITAEDVEMQMSVASNVQMELPTGKDFNDAQLVTDHAEIGKVEG